MFIEEIEKRAWSFLLKYRAIRFILEVAAIIAIIESTYLIFKPIVTPVAQKISPIIKYNVLHLIPEKSETKDLRAAFLSGIAFREWQYSILNPFYKDLDDPSLLFLIKQFRILEFEPSNNISFSKIKSLDPSERLNVYFELRQDFEGFLERKENGLKESFEAAYQLTTIIYELNSLDTKRFNSILNKFNQNIMFIQKYRSIRFPHIPIQDYIKSNSINKIKVMKNAIDSLKEIKKFLGVKN
jgi:hypothetical protein